MCITLGIQFFAIYGGEKGRGLVLKYTTIYEQKDGQVYIDSAVQ